MVKDLTHYFNSPKEDENNSKIQNTETTKVEEKAPPKKRKISLSKRKKSKGEIEEDKTLFSDNIQSESGAELNHKKLSAEKVSNKKNKKRKLEDDSDNRPKKIKITKTIEISLKKCDSKQDKRNFLEQIETKFENNGKSGLKIDLPEKELVFLESSNSSEEAIKMTKKNQRLKTNLFPDSDNETSSLNQSSEPTVTLPDNSEIFSNTTSRNSLFSYFNKVNKETVLKQQKLEKIKVEAIVHSSPNGNKIERHKVDKLSHAIKQKKYKNKKHLGQVLNSDTIEVISSEDIVDKNSSVIVKANSPIETQSKNKSPIDNSIVVVSKPSNLASIFIPKKVEQQNKDSKTNSISDTKNENVFAKKKEKEHFEKQTNDNKLKQSIKTISANNKSKNYKSLSNKNKSYKKSTNSSIELSCDESLLTTEEKVRLDGKKRLVDKSKENFKNKPNCFFKTNPNSEEQTEKLSSCNRDITEDNKRNTLLSRHTVKSIDNLKNSNCVTPEKTKVSNLKSPTNKETTPNKKVLTINGYFTPKNKKSSSGENHSISKSPSPWVMKVRLSASKHQNENDEDEEDSQDSSNTNQELNNKVEVPDTPPVVVIDDNEDSSSVKDDECKRRSLPRTAKKQKQQIEEEKEVIVKPQAQKPAVKVWPFFLKGGNNKPKAAPVDQAKLKAKMLFLESGVPEVIKRKVETVKSDPVLGSPAPFPSVSHITQADMSSCSKTETTKLPLPLVRSVSASPTVPDWTPLLSMASQEEPEIPVFERPGNVKAFLEKLKKEDPYTDVKVLYKTLKAYKNKAELDIWTEVYKPTNPADMVGNSKSIKKLKSWLEKLKNCRKREGSVSSGDEFVNYESDDETSSFDNMAIICGPCGCGKTCAVYAIAKELDIKVLEINASCNRSGKRILAEFSESTQSHHVERSQPINGFFNNQSSRKKKRKKSKISRESKSEKTSLILVEDADLLFADCDEGFVPALASLAASSKRPIVLVTNLPHAPHLDRFRNSKIQQVSFSRPRPSKLALWLRLVALAEGVAMSSEQSLQLVTLQNCDVRRCLLQLQLMVHSNNSEVTEKLSAVGLWWKWPAWFQLSYELPTLLEPEEEQPSLETDKKLVLKQLHSVADTATQLANLDMLNVHSRMVSLEDCEEPCPVAWRARWRDSTVLIPAVGSDDGELHSAVTTWLQQTVDRSGSCPGLLGRTRQSAEEAKWLSLLREGEKIFMSGITPAAHTSHQAVVCDYFPTLREMSRSDKTKLANYTRRANRLFSYIQGLGIDANESYREFMCDAFS